MTRRSLVALMALGLVACRGPARSHDVTANSIDSVAENKPFGAIDATAVDRAVSPCTDFYAYACGAWEARTRIPDDEGAWQKTWSHLREASDATAAALLRQDAFGPSSYPSSRALGDFFAACLDTTAIDARGDFDLRTELDRIDTSAPAKVAASIARLHLLGVDPVFAFEPEPDPADAREAIAVLRQPALTMPESRYADPDAITAVHAHASRLFVLAGDSPGRAEEEARSAIDVEASLARRFESRAVFRDPAHLVRVVSAHDLPQIQPHLQWGAYFASLGIAAPARVHVATETYLRSLTPALADAQNLRAFLRWSFLRAIAPETLSPYREAAFAFARVDSGQVSPQPRERECTRVTERLLGEALAAQFAAAVVDPETAERALAIADEVRGEIARELADTHRDRIAAKVARLRIEVEAAPESASLPDFDRSRFVGDLFRAREYAAKMRLACIGHPTKDRSGDIFFAPNAAFDPRRNRIGVSPALLQDASLPEAADSAELGSLGSIFGHEIAHVFDRVGSSYDAQGTFDPAGSRDATPNAATEAILRDLEDARLRSGALVDETMADVVGVEIARRALHHLRDGADDRAFFTAYAQLWCGELRPEMMRSFVLSDAHPPPHVRVNETVRRSPAFAEAFSCK